MFTCLKLLLISRKEKGKCLGYFWDERKSDWSCWFYSCCLIFHGFKGEEQIGRYVLEHEVWCHNSVLLQQYFSLQVECRYFLFINSNCSANYVQPKLLRIPVEYPLILWLIWFCCWWFSSTGGGLSGYRKLTSGKLLWKSFSTRWHENIFQLKSFSNLFCFQTPEILENFFGKIFSVQTNIP